MVARQNSQPVQFERSRRTDASVLMSSGRAGKSQAVGYIPVLRGDSLSGSVGIDVDLAPMPRPLLNGVQLNFQAWFVPKSAHPQFPGYDEFMASYQKKPIKQLGAADRTPSNFFTSLTGTALTNFGNSEFAKDLGIHINTDVPVNTDLMDAYTLIHNFRLAAHSSKLARRQYSTESLTNSQKWDRAFWPTGRFSRVVADYERALIVGSLDLDVAAGRMPVSGIGVANLGATAGITANWGTESGAASTKQGWKIRAADAVTAGEARLAIARHPDNPTYPIIFAEMGNQSMNVALADIEKARTTQAFANLRASYAGNDATGFDNDDTIVAELMQGFRVPEAAFSRPWLLDAKRVGFGFQERHSTDSAALDVSMTEGRASARLSLNLPQQDVGGVIMFIIEVLPERIYERQSDEWLNTIDQDKLPDALRDIQRSEPVDLVLNRRLDAKHTSPAGLYGYEPMNDVWNREATRLGGSFYQATPGAPWTEQRSALWIAEVVNPAYTADHFLAPAAFPHNVFSDTEAPAFEFVCRHAVSIVGLTQIGDVLAENNDDYKTVQGA